MKLIIDRGNTSTKVHIFTNKELSGTSEILNNSVDFSNELMAALPDSEPSAILISDVAADQIDWDLLLSFSSLRLRMSVELKLPVKIDYQTPDTLGHDRIANIVGARVMNPDKACVVIDIGTCIKYDSVDRTGTYSGGAISPGLNMRFTSLHEHTGQLPLIEPGESAVVPVIGSSTTGSIRSGVINGITSEIEDRIRWYRSLDPQIPVVITGGDHAFFAPILKSPIFVAPELTARGLNEILDINSV